MTNLEKYTKVFMDVFEAEEDKVKKFAFKQVQGWDSIGHLSLIASLEEAFDIELEPEEILSIRSFDSGIEILKTKSIVF